MKSSTRLLLCIFVPVCVLLFAPSGNAAPFFVDLESAANTALEDDGTADNGKGGWSDEGINDMFIYPPVERGTFSRNGYQFRIIDPADNEGRAVIMLKGERRATGHPASVIVDVPEARGRYVYFLQNAVGQVSAPLPNYVVATYTVTYADGETREISVRDSIEIKQWWTGEWFDNSGAASWPVFMGRNLYSMKWKRFIGVWAMQWENPRPDEPIKSITLNSTGKAVPVIWAVTIADEDYYHGPDVKKDYKRPPDPPSGYFAAKYEKEREGVFEAARDAGLLKGVRRVDLIRNDILAVTVDSALGRIGAGDGTGIVEEYQRPGNFTVKSETDGHYVSGVKPVKVGRHSFESWKGDVGAFPGNILYFHTFYLLLPKALSSGHSYGVTVAGIDDSFATQAKLTYEEMHTATPVIKVNQVAYSSRAARRYAYLGWWAGDLGKVDYGMLKAFEVIDEASGTTALTGPLALRRGDDEISGEDVYELDLSELKRAGMYHIRIPGLGRSNRFDVGGKGIDDLYHQTLRAFYHQRCGQELKPPYTTFTRPACHLQVYESGYLVGNRQHVVKPDEAVRTFVGGYHDAADYDCFTYHLRATSQALTAYEQAPDAFKDGDLNIPESGNSLPDVLDEAGWALGFYRENQRPDGAVPKGRGNDQDAIRGWEREHKSRPAFGIFLPTNMSATEFAAVAAQYARLIGPHDTKRAVEHLAASERAYAWAKEHPTQPEQERGEKLFLSWAAAELFRTTGKAGYNDDFMRLYGEDALSKYHWQYSQYAPLCWWSYAVCTQPGTDEAVREAMRSAIIKRADDVVAKTEKPAYRMGHGGERGLGWGTGNGGGHYADPCLRAYWLTGEQKYIDAASLNADFQLGANPLSKSFVTSMGARYPTQPQISPELYTGPQKTGQTVKGITIYGLTSGNVPGYPAEVPPYRRVRDISGGAEVSSEFTITETIGASAILYGTLHSLEKTKP